MMEFSWDQSKVFIPWMSALFADMATCVRFFSRLQLPAVNTVDTPAAPPDFTRISRAAPLAGAFVALPAAGAGLLLGMTDLPALVIAVAVAAVLTIVTGALHEDGLSDVADGFFGGATVEKRLDIMKDSRIGAFGTVALVFAILLRVALIAALLDRFSVADAVLLVVTGEAVSRFLLVWQWSRHPLARPDGLAARFGKPDRDALHQALLVTTVLILPAVFCISLTGLALGLITGAIVALLAGQLAVKKIKGTTGDVLGAIQQLSGLGFLTGLLMVP
ncbi:adenosylcobinamide-GDP ribazoletransferase [Labrenzia sp. PHM005]|uniref:adenosylcobinamide-GDP ribazoletransferase n=1 Tax=Labrenzia sp. PHM005 TaxID=2590016 RepID=UPI001AD8BF2D|nr:adenosylcobinamide-GDP ribazoletransferase [Labrenzia sp. PHM005]